MIWKEKLSMKGREGGGFSTLLRQHVARFANFQVQWNHAITILYVTIFWLQRYGSMECQILLAISLHSDYSDYR